MMKHDDPAAEIAAIDPAVLNGLLNVALRRGQAVVTQDFAARFGAEGLRPTQYATLALLRRHPGLRQNQVSEALGVQRTNFVPLLDSLEKRGLAERRRVAGDRRAAALFLTDAGLEMLDRLAEIARTHEERFTRRLGAENRSVLMGLLARLTDPAFDA